MRRAVARPRVAVNASPRRTVSSRGAGSDDPADRHSDGFERRRRRAATVVVGRFDVVVGVVLVVLVLVVFVFVGLGVEHGQAALADGPLVDVVAERGHVAERLELARAP